MKLGILAAAAAMSFVGVTSASTQVYIADPYVADSYAYVAPPVYAAPAPVYAAPAPVYAAPAPVLTAPGPVIVRERYTQLRLRSAVMCRPDIATRSTVPVTA